jgi:cytoskeletal protein RodZ
LPTATRTTPEPSVAAGLTAPVSPSLSQAAPENSPKDTSLPSVVVIPPASPGIVVTAEKPPAKDDVSEKASANPKTETNADEKAAKNSDIETDNKKPQVYGENETAARVVIRATQNTWILVTDGSGKTLFEHNLKPGESYKVPNKSGLSLTTNNGSGILLSLDGKDLKKISKGASRMVRNINLDPNNLLEEFGASSH